MPEQLTKHPEVTLQVLRSAGARCGDGAPQDILKSCPAARFCKVPGGELCVYGLPEATQMTQVTAAEWRSLLPAQAPPSSPWIVGGAGLALGLALGVAVTWLRPFRRR